MNKPDTYLYVVGFSMHCFVYRGSMCTGNQCVQGVNVYKGINVYRESMCTGGQCVQGVNFMVYEFHQEPITLLLCIDDSSISYHRWNHSLNKVLKLWHSKLEKLRIRK